MPRGGRSAKSADKHRAEGKKHLSKKELEDRQQSELRMGEYVFKCPEYVKSDKVAYDKWQEVLQVFETIATWGIVSSGDTGHIARYCVAYSEYIDLVNRRRLISNIDNFSMEEEIKIDEEFEERSGKRGARNMWKKVDFIISTAGILSLDAAINKKMQQLITMEDRLFLNPLSKVKHIVQQKPKEDKKDSPLDQFEL